MQPGNDDENIDHLISRLHTQNIQVKIDAALKLGISGSSKAITPLLALLSEPETDAFLIMEITPAFRALEEPALQALVRALRESPNSTTRANVAATLRELLDTRATPALIEALKDEDATVRWQSAYSLYRLWDNRAAIPLIPLLNDPVARVRQEAASALGAFREEQIVLPLTIALEDENEEVRTAAAYSLGNLGDERAVEPLIRALEDPSLQVQRASVESLGILKDRRAVEPLIKHLENEAELAQWIVPALAILGDSRAIGPLIQVLLAGTPEVSREAMRGLHRFGNQVVEPLILALETRNIKWEVCQRIASILGKIKELELDLLLKALQSENSNVRFWLVTALGRTGNVRAIPYLEKLAIRDTGVNQAGQKVSSAARQAINQIQQGDQKKGE